MHALHVASVFAGGCAGWVGCTGAVDGVGTGVGFGVTCEGVVVAVPVCVAVAFPAGLCCGFGGNVGISDGFCPVTCVAGSCGISALKVAGAAELDVAPATEARAPGSSVGLFDRTNMTTITATAARPAPDNPSASPFLLPPRDFGAAMIGTAAAGDAIAAGDTIGFACVAGCAANPGPGAAAGKFGISGMAAVA